MPQFILFQDPILDFLSLALGTFIYWFPPVAVFTFWDLYMRYIQATWIKQIDWVLLEIRIPKLISKSPAAMEVVLSVLHQTSEGSMIDRFIKGRTRPGSYLEMVSINGAIHFFIKTDRRLKNVLEAAIYSQYPEVEVFEADIDYAHQVPYGLPGSDWELWGVEFKLEKSDPYPIKTYVDYGLDKDPKEEFKVDPLSTFLEFLGSVGPNEQLWFQIAIRATKDRYRVPLEIFKPSTWFKKVGWKEQAADEVDKIMKRGKYRAKPEGELGFRPMNSLSGGEEATIKAIERTLNKYGFDAGVRLIYLARKDFYNKAIVPRLLTALKQYGHPTLNGFKGALFTSFDYPWQDFGGWRLAALKLRMFNHHRLRTYFYFPAYKTPFVLSTEELATMYHFPSQVSTAPSLERISSKRGEPPVNLPI